MAGDAFAGGDVLLVSSGHAVKQNNSGPDYDHSIDHDCIDTVHCGTPFLLVYQLRLIDYLYYIKKY
jgi:hypothetical protein